MKSKFLIILVVVISISLGCKKRIFSDSSESDIPSVSIMRLSSMPKSVIEIRYSLLKPKNTHCKIIVEYQKGDDRWHRIPKDSITKKKILRNRYEITWKYDPGHIQTEDIEKCRIKLTPYIGGEKGISDVSGNIILKSSPKPGTLKWMFKAGNIISGGPIIDEEGIIYIGWDNTLYALTKGGEKKWKTNFNSITPPFSLSRKGTIYIIDTISKEGIPQQSTIHAVDKKTGKHRWVYNDIQKLILNSSPAIKDDVLYVGSYYKTGGYLYAITAKGNKKWQYRTKGGIQSSPSIGEDGTIYFGCQDFHVYAISNNGKLKWKRRLGWRIISSPTLDDKGHLYIGSSDKKLYTLDKTGEIIWSFKTEGQVTSSPVIGENNNIYFGTGKGILYCLNEKGKKQWSFSTGRNIGSFYAIGKDSVIYTGGSNGNYNALYALNSKGDIKWIYPTFYSPTGSVLGFVFKPKIDKDGIIYFASNEIKTKENEMIRRGFLYAVNTSSKGHCNSSWPVSLHDNMHTCNKEMSIKHQNRKHVK